MTGELWTGYHRVGQGWVGLCSVGGSSEAKHSFFPGFIVSVHFLKESVRFPYVFPQLQKYTT